MITCSNDHGRTQRLAPGERERSRSTGTMEGALKIVTASSSKRVTMA